ncbi:FAD-binding PCMH-type domain-containing protein, partial [Haematococcus lacustris]
PFFCANPDASTTKQAVVAQSGSGKSQSSSVNIMMTALRPLKIKVLEDEEAVLVDAGVITIDLLNYLSSYVTAKAPAGWTLPAFPWYVYQTVGGAVSTGTHGSSLKWGTMSNQVLEVQMVAANGSLVTLTPASHPFLMRAARVSVGKLGIITQLKMRIVREEPVTRRLRLMPASAFVTLMREVQTSAEQGSHPGWLNETEFFWLPQRSEFMMVSFTRGDAPDLATRQAVLASYVPQNTTVYQTSQQLLQDKSLQRVQDLPLKPVSFSAPGGLTKDAWEDTEFVLQQQVNAPFTLPRTSSGSSVEPGRQALYRMFGRFGQSGDEPLNPVASGMSWKPPAPRMANVMYGLPASAPGLLEVSRVGVMSIAYNATVEATAAYLKEPEIYELTIKTVLFDQ